MTVNVAAYPRIRLRRGLKADLPLTALPGEALLTTDTRELYVGLPDGSVAPLKLLVNSIDGLLGPSGKVSPALLPPALGGSGSDNNVLVVPDTAARNALVINTDVFNGDIIVVQHDLFGVQSAYVCNGTNYVPLAHDPKRHEFELVVTVGNATLFELTAGILSLSWAAMGAPAGSYDFMVQLDGRILRYTKGWQLTTTGIELWIPTPVAERAHWFEVGPVYNVSWYAPST